MRLTALDFYKELFSELDPAKLQRKFLQLLLEMQNVQRGSVWIKTGDRYLCAEAVGVDSEKVKGISLPTDQPSIVSWVIESGQMTMAEAGKDPRHFKEIEESFDVKSSIILCFPIKLASGEIYGAVQIIETGTGELKNLEQDYLDILQSLVDLGSTALSNALSYADKLKENQELKKAIHDIAGEGTIIGQSIPFLAVMKRVRDYARTEFPVLITGESGTGKELVASELHRNSPRRGQPFLVQNCSAIPDTLLESELFGYKQGAFTGANKDKIGLFEAASGGTVFLDEIGDMPLSLQAKILRVLQNHEIKPLGATKTRQVDVRIISATNKDLREAIKQDQFREDLFYRLSVLPLHVPPLRDRADDIPLLLTHFFIRESQKMGVAAKRLAPEAMHCLSVYSWKGNIRELENFVKYIHATVSGEVVDLEDLPAYIRRGDISHLAEDGPLPESAGAPAPAAPPPDPFADLTWDEVERNYVKYLLEKTRWNVTRSAQIADVKRSTFVSRMKRLGLNKNGQ